MFTLNLCLDLLQVDYPQTIGHAAGQQGSLQQPYGLEHKGPYRSIPVGPAQWVSCLF